MKRTESREVLATMNQVLDNDKNDRRYWDKVRHITMYEVVSRTYGEGDGFDGEDSTLDSVLDSFYSKEDAQFYERHIRIIGEPKQAYTFVRTVETLEARKVT